MRKARKAGTKGKEPLTTQEHNRGDSTVVESRRVIITVKDGNDIVANAPRQTLTKECHALVMDDTGDILLCHP